LLFLHSRGSRWNLKHVSFSFANLLSRFQFSGLFFFSVILTLGRGHKVWLSKFSVPYFCSLPKHKASISGFSAPFQLVQVHLQQLDPEGTVEVEQNAPAPRSHFRFRRGFFLVGPKKIVEELVEDWMDWNCWLCSDNLTQDARMPTTQDDDLLHFFRIRNPQLLGPSWLPRLHLPGELVGDCWGLGFVDLEKQELCRSWRNQMQSTKSLVVFS